MFNLGVHWIDLYRWLLADEVVEVIGKNVHVNREYDIEDNSFALLTFSRGTVLALDISYTVPDSYPFGRDLYLALRGTAGVLSWSPSFEGVKERLFVCSDAGEFSQPSHQHLDFELPRETGYAGVMGHRFMRELIESIRTGKPPAITAHDGLKAPGSRRGHLSIRRSRREHQAGGLVADFPVVLLAVNLTRLLILLLVNIGALAGSKVTAIRLPHAADLSVQSLFAIFLPRRFSRSHLAAANPLRDAVLLVLAPLANLVVAIIGGAGIVLVLVDLPGKAILLTIQRGAVGSGQMAIVRGTHLPLPLVQIGLPVLQILGFSRRQLAAINTIGNPILLILLALGNARRGRALRKHDRPRHYQRRHKDR